MPTGAEVREKVQRLLVNEFGPVRVDHDGDFFLVHGSAVVFLGVDELLDPGRTFIRIFCPMLRQVPSSPELFHWVATAGQGFRVGSVAANDDEGMVRLSFRYGLFGDDIDPAELIHSVIWVAATADSLDNMLLEMFGGELFGPQ